MEEKNYLTYDLNYCIRNFAEELDDESCIELIIEPLLNAVKESRILLKHYKVTNVYKDEFTVHLKILFNIKNLLNVDEVDFTSGIDSKSEYPACDEEELHLLLLESLRKVIVYNIMFHDAYKKIISQDGEVLYLLNLRFTFGDVVKW